MCTCKKQLLGTEEAFNNAGDSEEKNPCSNSDILRCRSAKEKAKIYRDIGARFFMLGKKDESLKAYRTANELDPDDKDGVNILILLLSDHLVRCEVKNKGKEVNAAKKLHDELLKAVGYTDRIHLCGSQLKGRLVDSKPEIKENSYSGVDRDGWDGSWVNN